VTTLRALLAIALLISLDACGERAPPLRNAVTEGTATDQAVLECREQADRNQPVFQAARGALIGAPIGAGIGAIVGGLLFANPLPAIWTGALAGGVGGAALGAAEGANLERAVDDCLTSRSASPKAPG
jgi:predicted small lipoprotein YifL